MSNPVGRIYGIDFGVNDDTVAVHGPSGPVVIDHKTRPSSKGFGAMESWYVPIVKIPADRFPVLLRIALRKGNVVVESATIGASGVEVKDIAQVLSDTRMYGFKLYVINGHAVGNYCRDHPEIPQPERNPDGTKSKESHAFDAMIIYIIATTTPNRLKEYKEPESDPLVRDYTSVRPMDQRNYNDDRSHGLLATLPDPSKLPQRLKDSPLIESGGRYRRKLAIPFAMALSEPWLWKEPIGDEPRTLRDRFIKIIGLYDHGYPSFYRREFNSHWMLENIKDSGEEMSPEVRKEALKKTSKEIRLFFMCCIRWKNGGYKEFVPPLLPSN